MTATTSTEATSPCGCGPTDVGAMEADAAQLCADQGLQFTTLRRQVYRIVCGHHGPLGAYDVLGELRAVDGQEKAAPVTVYRALDFLLDAGLVHRVEALNAFTACHAKRHGHSGLLLICSQCRHVTELENSRLERQIADAAGAEGFATAGNLVEISGLCAGCRD